MRSWMRRIRGALGMGLTWAAGWMPLGIVWSLLPFVSPPSLAVTVTFAIQYAVMGFVGGTSFSLVLGAFGGRRRFDEMSLSRFALWGGIGGVLMNVVLNTVVAAALRAIGVPVPPFALANVIFGAATTLLAAGSAAGSLALARGQDDRELLEAGAEVGDVGLSAEEMRELLG